MARFLLVHGAFHGGWCWERLTPLLESMGHEVMAPDLQGMGLDETPLVDVDFSLWSRGIVDLLHASDRKTILVGHSRGGMVISQAANDAPGRVAGLVYVTALMMPESRSLATLMGDLAEIDPPQLDAVPTVDGAGLLITAQALAERVYDRTAPAGLERAIARVTPEPLSSLEGAPHFARAAHLPRAYVECLHDRTLTIGCQRFMQQAWPCDPVMTIATDHSPQFSAPDILAGMLDDLAARWN